MSGEGEKKVRMGSECGSLGRESPRVVERLGREDPSGREMRKREEEGGRSVGEQSSMSSSGKCRSMPAKVPEKSQLDEVILVLLIWDNFVKNSS